MAWRSPMDPVGCSNGSLNLPSTSDFQKPWTSAPRWRILTLVDVFRHGKVCFFLESPTIFQLTVWCCESVSPGQKFDFLADWYFSQALGKVSHVPLQKCLGGLGMVPWSSWSPGQSFGNPCHIIYIWYIYGISMVYLWNIYGISIISMEYDKFALISIIINPWRDLAMNISCGNSWPVFWPWKKRFQDILLQGDLDMEVGRISFSKWLEMDETSPSNSPCVGKACGPWCMIGFATTHLVT